LIWKPKRNGLSDSTVQDKCSSSHQHRLAKKKVAGVSSDHRQYRGSPYGTLCATFADPNHRNAWFLATVRENSPGSVYTETKITVNLVAMETPITVAIIAAAASAITFLLTRMKERESEWRKLRVEQYKELVTSMSEVVAEQSDASRARLALAANHIGL
jgi:hypothetical protein